MNISQLEYYVAAINEGSFARAGQKLHVTTQAISKSIRDLENEFDVSLMVRDGRGVKPTSLGLIIANQARIVLEECRNLKIGMTVRREIKELQDGLSIAVCTAECRGDLFSRRFFSSLKRDNPKLHLDISYGLNEGCFELVRSGSVDMALALGDPSDAEGIATRYIAAFEPRFAVSPNHSLARKGALRLSELEEATIALPLDIRCCLLQLKNYLVAGEVKVHFESVRLTSEAHENFLNKDGVVMVLNDNPSVLPGIDRLILSQAGKSRLRFPVYLCASMKASRALYNEFYRIMRKEMAKQGYRSTI